MENDDCVNITYVTRAEQIETIYQIQFHTHSRTFLLRITLEIPFLTLSQLEGNYVE